MSDDSEPLGEEGENGDASPLMKALANRPASLDTLLAVLGDNPGMLL